MLLATAKIAKELAGGPCIASLGYANAAVLLEEYDQIVTRFLDQDSKFLLKLLHKVDLHTRMVAQSFADDVEKGGDAPFEINDRYLKDLELDNEQIFHKIRRQEVDFLLLPAELAQKLVQKTPPRSKPTPRSDPRVNTPARNPGPSPGPGTQSQQKKGRRDDWCAPIDAVDPHEKYFGQTDSGLANVLRIKAIKFRHHRKFKTDWTNTSLCIPFAIGLTCKRGKFCSLNHRTREQALHIHKDKDKIPVLDSIFSAIYH